MLVEVSPWDYQLCLVETDDAGKIDDIFPPLLRFTTVEAIREELEAALAAVNIGVGVVWNEDSCEYELAAGWQPTDATTENDQPSTGRESRYGSPVFCEHANEVPGRCPCEPLCYCKANTCKETP